MFGALQPGTEGFIFKSKEEKHTASVSKYIASLANHNTDHIRDYLHECKSRISKLYTTLNSSLSGKKLDSIIFDDFVPLGNRWQYKFQLLSKGYSECSTVLDNVYKLAFDNIPLQEKHNYVAYAWADTCYYTPESAAEVISYRGIDSLFGGDVIWSNDEFTTLKHLGYQNTIVKFVITQQRRVLTDIDKYISMCDKCDTVIKDMLHALGTSVVGDDISSMYYRARGVITALDENKSILGDYAIHGLQLAHDVVKHCYK